MAINSKWKAVQGNYKFKELTVEHRRLSLLLWKEYPQEHRKHLQEMESRKEIRVLLQSIEHNQNQHNVAKNRLAYAFEKIRDKTHRGEVLTNTEEETYFIRVKDAFTENEARRVELENEVKTSRQTSESLEGRKTNDLTEFEALKHTLDEKEIEDKELANTKKLLEDDFINKCAKYKVVNRNRVIAKQRSGEEVGKLKERADELKRQCIDKELETRQSEVTKVTSTLNTLVETLKDREGQLDAIMRKLPALIDDWTELKNERDTVLTTTSDVISEKIDHRQWLEHLRAREVERRREKEAIERKQSVMLGDLAQEISDLKVERSRLEKQSVCRGRTKTF